MYVLSDPKTKFYLSDGRKLEAGEQIALTDEQVLAFKGLFTKVGEAEAEDGASAPNSAPAQEPAKVESKAPATSTTPSK